MQYVKPATITSLGLLVVALANLVFIPPFVLKLGWLFVAIGTIWFFIKTR